MSERSGEGREAEAVRRSVRGQLGRWTLLLFTSLFPVPQALALGLGQAQVQSYLDQQLVARIDLISRSEAEMATVTAGLASPADFQVLGLTRSAIATPLEFEIYRDLSDPHIRVTSRLPMDEPVVQLVVEVVWASGRMLRQYTLFLDPPTFDAPAPLPAPSARRTAPPPSVPVVREDQSAAPPYDPAGALAAVEPAPEASQRDLSLSSEPVPAAQEDEPGELQIPEASGPVADRSTEVLAAGPPFDPVEDAPLSMTPEAPASAEPVESAEFGDEAPADAPSENPASVGQDERQEPAATSSDVQEPALASSVAEKPALTDEPQEASAEGVPGSAPEEFSRSADPEPAAPEPVEPEPVEPEPVQPEPAEPIVQAPEPPARAVLPEPGQPFPNAINVQRGDTLWSISAGYAEAKEVSINQVMLAVQQKNPDAFIEGNINAMKAGEILRMPTRDEVLARSVREAMLEVLRQESLYRTRWDLPPSPDALPTISNLADAGSGTDRNGEGVASADGDRQAAPFDAVTAEEDSRLVLVPPSEAESRESQGMGQGGSGETGVSSGESVVEELARAREELANAQQENAYLVQRLAELEGELGRREATDTTGLADTNLAEMEARLREDRLAGEEEPELALPPQESTWLSRYGLALAGLMVLALVTLVWFLRSRRDPEFTAGMDEPDTVTDDRDDPHTEPTLTDGPESDDPETLLDLARAYMAMGKITQARDCIEAVTRIGTPSQVREARTMLAEL